MEKRPRLNKSILIKDFQEFYWLKKELQNFCRSENLSSTGSKTEIADRISIYISTGKDVKESTIISRPISKFDWTKEKLTPETIITDSYKSSENVRKFFRNQIGKSFRFNVLFMDWIKANVGLTLGDAVAMWWKINDHKKKNNQAKVIKPQFEYNTYLRDFLLDNPGKKRAIGIKLWKLKKLRRGSNQYEHSDFQLLKMDK